MGFIADKIVEGIIKRVIKKAKDAIPTVKKKALDYFKENKEEILEKVYAEITKVVSKIIEKIENKS